LTSNNYKFKKKKNGYLFLCHFTSESIDSNNIFDEEDEDEEDDEEEEEEEEDEEERL